MTDTKLPDYVLVPREPTEAMLKSMAVRYDHGLGVPGYYDQPMFVGLQLSHAQRFESTLRTMRQLYEEATGQGFCTIPQPAPQGEPVAWRRRHPRCNCAKAEREACAKLAEKLGLITDDSGRVRLGDVDCIAATIRAR